MTGQTAGAAGGGQLMRVVRPLSWITQSLNVVGTLMVLGLVLIVNGDALSRNLFNAPFKGIVEAVQFSLVLIVFLQLADVVRVDRLTRSDGFLLALSARFPRAGNALARVIDLASAVFMMLICWTIYPEFVETLENGRYMGVPGVFTVPVWPQNLAITVASALSALLFLLKAITGQRRPDLDPGAETGMENAP